MNLKTIKPKDALAKVLRERRLHMGLSQQKLVDRADVDIKRRSYGAIEDKLVVPNANTLESVAKVLELDVEGLKKIALDMLSLDIDLSEYVCMRGDYNSKYAYNYHINKKGTVYKEAKIRPNGFFVPSKIILPYTMTNGYLGVNVWLSTEKPMVEYHHRLLALSFLKNNNPKHYNVINHKNGVKDDNRLENLEWVTNQINLIHALDNGLNHHGDKSSSSTISNQEAINIYLSDESENVLAKRYGISRSQVGRIRRKENWRRVIDQYLDHAIKKLEEEIDN